jgi:hypothetical protein
MMMKERWITHDVGMKTGVEEKLIMMKEERSVFRKTESVTPG